MSFATNSIEDALDQLSEAVGSRCQAENLPRDVRVVKTPVALVFARGGEYVGAIERIQNWSDYLVEIRSLLVAPPRRAPGFSIPVVTA